MISKTNKDRHFQNNALHYRSEAKMYKCDAAIHVEAAIDVVFWKNIFKQFLPQKKFYFVSYSKTNTNAIATGSSTCLKYKTIGSLSKDFFVCIDSDYRYLLKEKDICVEKFVFQTYTYSIENHWCYSDRINSVFEKMGLQNTIFNFNLFLQLYSGALYELFLYHLHSVLVDDGFFTKKDFIQYLIISKIEIDSMDLMIERVKNQASIKLEELKDQYADVNIEELKQEYYELGLKKENAYLYFRGHNVFEQVVLNIAKAVKRELQRIQQVNQIPRRERRVYYENNSLKMETCFQYDLYFGAYNEIRKIEKDIEKYLNTK